MNRFPYVLRGEPPRLRPAVPVLAQYGERTRRFHALLDTGADLTVVDRSVADRLGVPLGRKGADRALVTVLGATWDVQFEHVDLSLPGTHETWSARVGFALSSGLRMPYDGLLGSAGFFDRYVVTFAEYHGWVAVEHASGVPPV